MPEIGSFLRVLSAELNETQVVSTPGLSQEWRLANSGTHVRLLRHKFDFRANHHLFSFAGQFDTTVTGTVSVDLLSVLIKNFCPSRVTS